MDLLLGASLRTHPFVSPPPEPVLAPRAFVIKAKPSVLPFYLSPRTPAVCLALHCGGGWRKWGEAFAPREPPAELGETGTAHREEESGVRLMGGLQELSEPRQSLALRRQHAGLGGQGVLPGGGGLRWALGIEKSVDNQS